MGDPLQVIVRHIDFAELAWLVDALIERGDGRRGGRPAYPTEVMVRILVLKRLYNLSHEQMEYQLLDRASYQRFCLLQDAWTGRRSCSKGWMRNYSATAISPGVARPSMRRWYPRPASTWTGRSARPWPKGAKPSAGKRTWTPRTRTSTAKATSATSSV